MLSDVCLLSQEQNQMINQSLALFPSSSETGKCSVTRWLLEAVWQRIYVYCFCDMTYGIIVKNICNSCCFYF